MSLIKLENASLNYGQTVLLEKQSLEIVAGDRLCLIGRNGAGKSSLMKVLSGEVELDDGSVWRKPSLILSRLEQDLPDADDLTVYDSVALGLGEMAQWLKEYEQLSQGASTEKDFDQLAKLQHNIEAGDGWGLSQRIETVLSRLGLDGTVIMRSLSGGWRRRVALARALARNPDVLLLDEPTNHLDVATIEWLEAQLLNFNGAIVFITHDRSFLEKLANRIVELDRGQLLQFSGTYDKFLEKKEALLAEEARHNALFDKRLAEEEKWIRQGIKARRTRNEGRVRALKAMRDERQSRKQRVGSAELRLSDASVSGKLVAQLERVHQSFGDRVVIDDFSTTIVRGDRIGLIGPNGAGKSTLLKIILGELSPPNGKVKLGTNLELAYFDQLRLQLNLDATPVDNISEGREFIEIDGKQKHIISYLQDFLFTGERARTPLRALSGGERNRVLLAKLFSKPSNLLVMDEPTNDLDVETLELLEEVLGAYSGTLLLVSHDRKFLNNVVTSTIAFEGQGVVREYVGGYEDWISQGGRWIDADDTKASTVESTASTEKTGTTNNRASSSSTDKPAKKASVKLSYKLQRELDVLPKQLETLENQIAQLEEIIGTPDFYNQDQEAIQSSLAEHETAKNALDEAFERWMELEAMANGEE